MEIARKYEYSLYYLELYEAVDDPSCDSIISWGKSNNSFIVWNPAELHKRILLKRRHMYCSNFQKFFSDLKYHGFKKVKGSEHMEYGNTNFVRGKPELMKKMETIAFSKNARKAFLEWKAKERKARAEKAALHLQNLRI